MNWKKGLGIIFALLIVVLVGIWLFSDEETEVGIPVRADDITTGAIEERVDFNGQVEASNREDFYGQGVVYQVEVEVGDTVSEDDLLATYYNGTTFTAPFDGTVTEVNIEADDTDLNLEMGEASLVLQNLDELQVTFSLPKSDASTVEEDQEALINYNDQEFEGTVSHVNPVATVETSPAGNSQALEGTISFDENPENVIAGFEVDGSIVSDSRSNALLLPIEALLFDEENQAYVYRIENGFATRVDIETGIQSFSHIEVLGGLAEGDTVILSPSEEVSEGTAVIPEQQEQTDEENNQNGDESAQGEYYGEFARN